jgi:anti-sigma factor RsiW
MTTHLSDTTLNSLVDGELSAEQSASAKEHLDQCPACTSSALSQSLLKTATAKAGQRYAVPTQLQERLRRLAASQEINASSAQHGLVSKTLSVKRIAALALPIAAVLLLLASSSLLLARYARNSQRASIEDAALVTEISDLHIATLATNQPPEVISSDRHTVKPWFQGKLPFSFNLPDNLPADTRLDGANLSYLHNRAVAQLLYSIGAHRVSVFIQQRPDAATQTPNHAEHAGFHVTGFDTSDLEITAVSDVDPSRLAGLVRAIEQAQTRH